MTEASSADQPQLPVQAPRVREMREGDLAAVARLESSSFSAPWSEETFHSLLSRPAAVLQVVEVESEVVAYAVLWCIQDQGELANIAVEPGHRGRGLGRLLLDQLLELSRERGVEDLFLEVRESNSVARDMYLRRGFEEVGRRSDYYDQPPEDALVLRLRLRKHL